MLDGHTAPDALRGKHVLIGVDTDVIGDRFFIPGYGRTGGVYVHAIGAETLRSGNPAHLGWFIPFLLALGMRRACASPQASPCIAH